MTTRTLRNRIVWNGARSAARPRRGDGAKHHFRIGQGHHRRRAAGRVGGGEQSAFSSRKSRSVVTDEQGRYSIVDLRPGIYTGGLHAAGILDAAARRHRAAGQFQRVGERRAGGWRARGNGHRVRRFADRRRPELAEDREPEARGARRAADGAHLCRRRVAGGRRQGRRPERRRGAHRRAAAALRARRGRGRQHRFRSMAWR